ncbi:MAG: protein arginine kinase, partial [Ruminococcaceae bacterium]|nr:protein arginine kinase [Oscillospiraceae bacterium]
MNHIVISSRVRLARNLKEFPFPSESTPSEKVIHAVKKAAGSEFTCLECNSMPPLDKQAMVEQHLISPALANRKNGAVLLNRDQSISIMVNEEDHLRIQCMMPGFQLKEAYERANKTDDRLEEHLTYAFDSEIGYLTSCPTNAGTGLRASVMLHLPALTANHQMNSLIASVGKMGFAVRGMYGEGSQAEGDCYQISNQITLGLSEEETLQRLQSVTEQLIEREQQLRQAMLERNRAKMCDMIWRAFGTVKYAQIMTSREFMTLASQIRLGISLGIITHIKSETLNRLMTQIQPAHLQQHFGKELSPEERDMMRAEY